MILSGFRATAFAASVGLGAAQESVLFEIEYREDFVDGQAISIRSPVLDSGSQSESFSDNG